MALARPPAGKEVAAGTGKTGGMYHWEKGRLGTGSSTASGAMGLDRGLPDRTPRSYQGQMEVLPECRPGTLCFGPPPLGLKGGTTLNPEHGRQESI